MRTVVAVTAALLTFAACSDDGDGDPDSSDDRPTSLEEPSPTATEQSAAEVEKEVKAVIRAYDRALETLNRARQVTPELAAVTTEAWADQLFTTYEDNIFSNDLEMVGRWRTSIESVSVAGDTAEADVCSDGNKVYVVERGSGIPNGARSQGRAAGVISLVRDDDGWQVDGNETGTGRC